MADEHEEYESQQRYVDHHDAEELAACLGTAVDGDQRHEVHDIVLRELGCRLGQSALVPVASSPSRTRIRSSSSLSSSPIIRV